MRVTLPLDHVGWLVDDLSAACASFSALGFAVTQPGTLKTGSADGEARDVGQRSAHIMFADTYLELTAVAPGARPSHLQPYMSTAGLIILALRVADAGAAHAALQAAGLTVTEPARSERPVAYQPPAQQGMAEFHWFMCASGDFPEVLLCCVEHVTPTLVFQSAVAEHGNGALALNQVLVFAPDPAYDGSRFQILARALGQEAGQAGLTILGPAAAAARFPGVEFGSRARAIGVGLQVASLDALAGARPAPSRWHRDGARIWCEGPSGTVLEFRT